MSQKDLEQIIEDRLEAVLEDLPNILDIDDWDTLVNVIKKIAVDASNFEDDELNNAIIDYENEQEVAAGSESDDDEDEDDGTPFETPALSQLNPVIPPLVPVLKRL